MLSGVRGAVLGLCLIPAVAAVVAGVWPVGLVNVVVAVVIVSLVGRPVAPPRVVEPEPVAVPSELPNAEALALRQQLARVSADFRQLGAQLETASFDVQRLVGRHDDLAQQQASSMAEIHATARQIAATGQDLTESVQGVSALGHEAAQLTDRSHTGLGSLQATARELSERSERLTESFQNLDGRAREIGKIISVMVNLADQTNLLALNAAVQAESAGLAGAGFRIVSAEIRRLSELTAVRTFEIEKTVEGMQATVAHELRGLDQLNAQLGSFATEIEKISLQQLEVIQLVEYMSPMFAGLAQGMEQQSESANEISLSIGSFRAGLSSEGPGSDVCEQLASCVATLQDTAAWMEKSSA